MISANYCNNLLRNSTQPLKSSRYPDFALKSNFSGANESLRETTTHINSHFDSDNFDPNQGTLRNPQTLKWPNKTNAHAFRYGSNFDWFSAQYAHALRYGSNSDWLSAASNNNKTCFAQLSRFLAHQWLFCSLFVQKSKSCG